MHWQMLSSPPTTLTTLCTGRCCQVQPHDQGFAQALAQAKSALQRQQSEMSPASARERMQRKVRDKKRTERQAFWKNLDAFGPKMRAESPTSTPAAGLCCLDTAAGVYVQLSVVAGGSSVKGRKGGMQGDRKANTKAERHRCTAAHRGTATEAVRRMQQDIEAVRHRDSANHRCRQCQTHTELQLILAFRCITGQRQEVCSQQKN